MSIHEPASECNAFLEIRYVGDEIRLYSMNLNFWMGDLKDNLIDFVLGEKPLRQEIFDRIITNHNWRKEFFHRLDKNRQ